MNIISPDPGSSTDTLTPPIGSTSAPIPLKRRRITRACDRCHKGGIKCAQGRSEGTCGPCESFGERCTYDRPLKRRGPSARIDGATTKGVKKVGKGGLTRVDDGLVSAAMENVAMMNANMNVRMTGVPGSLEVDEVDDYAGWRAEHTASPSIIEHLVDAFHRIVYPILTYFHWPTFSHDVRRRRYLHDRPFFATTMAVCAMSSARLRDGAVIPFLPPLDPHCPPSEVFYAASTRSIPKDLLQAGDFDYKRAKALLGMLCIQYGRVVETKLHLGELSTMFSLEGFHHESKWPTGLNAIEVEERRRLCWCVYQLDIYASIIFGMMTHHRESQMTVAYPTEVYDDTEITASGIIPSRPARGVSWLRGWNCVVDLYRILEHASDRLRASKVGGPTTLDEVTGLFSRKGGPHATEVLEIVSGLYDSLPVEFKLVKAMTGDLEKDRYGFTATNIIITLQTLRSVIAGFEEANVHQRCTIAAEMLDSLASVPVSYIQAGSAPMFHHLAGVGHLLGSIIQSPLSQHTYLRVRTVLLALADMTASLEVALSATSDIAGRLRGHVSRIDTYMTEAALQHQHAYVPPMGMSISGSMSDHPYLSMVPQYGQPTSNIPSSSFGLPDLVAAAGIDLDAAQQPSMPQPSEEVATRDQKVDLPQPTQGGQDPGSPHPFGWAPSANVSPTYQFQLPDDLFADWPFDFGQGDVFDWLGDVQAQAQFGEVLPGPGAEGTSG